MIESIYCLLYFVMVRDIEVNRVVETILEYRSLLSEGEKDGDRQKEEGVFEHFKQLKRIIKWGVVLQLKMTQI